jgi:hypothetical protein
VAEVFISHSARKDEEILAVLHALRDALEDAGFDVWLDKARLEPGAVWRDEIDRALLRCDAAVVVVSDTALVSDWVLKETSILSARRRVGRAFPLIPVIVPPMTVDRLQRSGRLDPVRLEDYQSVQAADPASGAEKVVAVLLPFKSRFDDNSPRRLQELRIATLLGDIDEDLLAAAGEHLNLRREDWALVPNRGRLFAQRLLEADLNALREAVDVMRIVRPEVASELFETAAPFAWVEWEAASGINDVVAADPPRAVGINSEETLTCEMYVRCAAANLHWGAVTGGFSGERTPEELCRHVRVALTGAFKGPPGGLIPDEQLKEILRLYKTVVIIPHPPPDDAALEEVKATFEDLTLFFAAGPEAETLLRERGLDFVRVLKPELDPTIESDALTQYRVVALVLGGGAGADFGGP